MATNELWPTVFLLLCLCLLIIIRLRAMPRVIKAIRSAYSMPAVYQMGRDEPNQFKMYSLLLSLFFILNLAFLFYKTNLAYGFILNNVDHFVQFVVFILLLLLLLSFKYLGNKLLAVFTGQANLLLNYEISSSLVNQALGLFLFPWIVLAQFSKLNPFVFISGALVTLGVSVLIKWYKGLVVGMVFEKIGLLQIFSYFCGLEILPVIIVVKYLVETF